MAEFWLGAPFVALSPEAPAGAEFAGHQMAAMSAFEAPYAAPLQQLQDLSADLSADRRQAAGPKRQRDSNGKVKQGSAGRKSAAVAAPSQGAPADADCEWALAQLGSVGRCEQTVAWVMTQAWFLARDTFGCRVVQQAIGVMNVQEVEAVVEQMKGNVLEASTSPHANHVLQKLIGEVHTDALQFVVSELRGQVAVVSRHRFGCRIIERLIQHLPAAQAEPLLEEVIASSQELCRHTFGNFVVQQVLEHGSSSQKGRVADMMVEDLQRLARHRVASHVVRSALVHCDTTRRAQLCEAMRSDAGDLTELAHHHCGSFVVREMRRDGGKR